MSPAIDVNALFSQSADNKREREGCKEDVREIEPAVLLKPQSNERKDNLSRTRDRARGAAQTAEQRQALLQVRQQTLEPKSADTRGARLQQMSLR